MTSDPTSEVVRGHKWQERDFTDFELKVDCFRNTADLRGHLRPFFKN